MHKTKPPPLPAAKPATSGTVSRRGLLHWIWGALGLAALAETGWLTLSFLRPQKAPADAAQAAVIAAGVVDAFEPGTVTAFPRGAFYLVRLEDGGFLALSCACTHLGCTVPWIEAEKRFRCPCHASAFNIRGEVLQAPAGRALDLFPVTIENQRVKVDTSRRIKRAGFEAGQAIYPQKK